VLCERAKKQTTLKSNSNQTATARNSTAAAHKARSAAVPQVVTMRIETTMPLQRRNGGTNLKERSVVMMKKTTWCVTSLNQTATTTTARFSDFRVFVGFWVWISARASLGVLLVHAYCLLYLVKKSRLGKVQV
jgi:hypothetical protein